MGSKAIRLRRGRLGRISKGAISLASWFSLIRIILLWRGFLKGRKLLMRRTFVRIGAFIPIL
jgi:hypothetical protein